MHNLKYGATMYMPATRQDLVLVGNGEKYPELRTLIFCTEDSVSDYDVPLAIKNIQELLPRLEDTDIFRFIRPRNPHILKTILDLPDIHKITGFVLPKISKEILSEYLDLLLYYPNFEIMPILETNLAFDLMRLYEFRDYILKDKRASQIKTLRIGAMDLLNILSLRRGISQNIYETPIGYLIDQLINVFKPAGLSLAAPGFEALAARDVLTTELSLDICRGLYAKTAIHPSQISIINHAYQVDPLDLDMAHAIQDPQNPQVFRFQDRMCEKAVHANWAEVIVERARLFGVKCFATIPQLAR
ncbi:MAG: HpcH/HpaI aldolase/citrate lyase family protein [Deltaproteobacteria bacterium]|jgi:citrate lyase beta subunit|nr:HpcH/HpaI aldolase/citrate lyase family protein [Deltaproteobacteria bacterium]